MNKSGITTETATAKNQILAVMQPMVAVGVKVKQLAGEDKVYKAGTPMAGSLTARLTAFEQETTEAAVVGNLTVGADGGTVVLPAEATSNAVGVLLHEVDTTDGDANGTLLIFGFVDYRKLDTATKALYTAAVKKALEGKVCLIGD